MLILLYGPFACGKTYFTDNSLLPHLKNTNLPVTVVNADHTREKYWENGELVEVREKRWNSKIENKTAMWHRCMDDTSRYYVVESGRPDGEIHCAPYFKKIGGGLYVVYLSCFWRSMKDWLVQRCEDRGKEFNKEYWNRDTLTDHDIVRFQRQITNNLIPNNVPHRIFMLGKDREGYDAVEQFLFYLFNVPPYVWYNSVWKHSNTTQLDKLSDEVLPNIRRRRST